MSSTAKLVIATFAASVSQIIVQSTANVASSIAIVQNNRSIVARASLRQAPFQNSIISKSLVKTQDLSSQNAISPIVTSK